MYIQLNRMHRLHKTDAPNTWEIQKLNKGKDWFTVKTVVTTRKGIVFWLEDNHIPVSRQAEEEIAKLPETDAGFKEKSGIDRT